MSLRRCRLRRGWLLLGAVVLATSCSVFTGSGERPVPEPSAVRSASVEAPGEPEPGEERRRKRKRSLRRDVPDGIETVRSRSGAKIAEGRNEDGYREGPWTFWEEDGSKQREAEFRRGRLHGRSIHWFPDGKTKRREATYRNGQLHGVFREWYSNGQLEEKAEYRNGRRHGVEVRYLKDGTPWWNARWEDGTQVAPHEANPRPGAGKRQHRP